MVVEQIVEMISVVSVGLKEYSDRFMKNPGYFELSDRFVLGNCL